MCKGRAGPSLSRQHGLGKCDEQHAGPGLEAAQRAHRLVHILVAVGIVRLTQLLFVVGKEADLALAVGAFCAHLHGHLEVLMPGLKRVG